MNLIDKQKAQLDDIYSGIQAAFLELSTDFVQPDWTDAELIRASVKLHEALELLRGVKNRPAE